MVKRWVILSLITSLVVACGREEGPSQQPKTNEELITEKFEIFKQGYKRKDIDAVISTLADNYHTKYNQGKAQLRDWLLSMWAGKDWTPDSVRVSMVSDIEVKPGCYPPWCTEVIPPSASLDIEISLPAKDVSQDQLISSLYRLKSSWEQTGGWAIVSLLGPTAHVITSPISLAPDSVGNIQLYTLPFGAPPQSFDTHTVTVLDWNGDSLKVVDQGDGRYVGTFNAPSSPGRYVLQATLTDTTYQKTLLVTHVISVK